MFSSLTGSLNNRLRSREPVENIELLAVGRGLLMMERMRDFNREKRFSSTLEIKLGVGIAQGNAVVGNIGCEQRTNYTAIGSCINVAARLEKMAKPKETLITEPVYEKIRLQNPAAQIGEYDLKGIPFKVKANKLLNRP